MSISHTMQVFVSFAGCELSLSPSGRVVVGLTAAKSDRAGGVQLQQWQLPKSTWPCQGSSSLQPHSVLGPTLHEPSIADLAWHPHHPACLYAAGDKQGVVHVIDGQVSRFLYSWTAVNNESCESSKTRSLKSPGNCSCCLAWSHVGHRLAASCDAISAVLRF